MDIDDDSDDDDSDGDCDGDGDNNVGDRKAKIDGLNTGDRLVHCCNRLSVVMMLSLR